MKLFVQLILAEKSKKNQNNFDELAFSDESHVCVCVF